MIYLANDKIRKFVKFISKPDIPAVELYVIPGYDVVETPEGEMGFAVYETETKRIIVPEGVTEEVKEIVLASIAHEYYHHIESVRGEEHDEVKAEEFANSMVSAYEAGSKDRRANDGKDM